MAARQPKAPAAFLSYAHLDDEESDGQITRLRQRLALAVSVAIGKRFEIFQDRADIAWGQHWPTQLDEALGRALFLIPIVTPAFFNSEFCRAELERFLELERQAGRNDLILPLYFRKSRAFEQQSDSLAAALSGRQYRDWRGLRQKPIYSPEVRQELEQLADEIEAAVHRPLPREVGGVVPKDIVEWPSMPVPARQVDLEPIERERRVVRNVALRAAPSLAAPIVTRLQAGTTVYVAGRVKDRVWLWIEEDELRGYVVEDAFRRRWWPFGAALIARPGQIFRDVEAAWCAELVVIPAGRFLMGSPESEEKRPAADGPQSLSECGLAPRSHLNSQQAP